MYFTYYSYVVIILFKHVYVGLHSLTIILENYFFVFLCFLCFLVLNRMFSMKNLTYVFSLFKKVLCNFIIFIKTHQTIYKNFFRVKT